MGDVASPAERLEHRKLGTSDFRRCLKQPHIRIIVTITQDNTQSANATLRTPDKLSSNFVSTILHPGPDRNTMDRSTGFLEDP